MFPDRPPAHLRGILVPQVRHDLSFPYTTAAMVGLHVDRHVDTHRAHSSNSPRTVGKSTRAEGIPGSIVALSKQRQAGRPSSPPPPSWNRAQRQQLSLESASLEGTSEDAATSTGHASQVSVSRLATRLDSTRSPFPPFRRIPLKRGHGSFLLLQTNRFTTVFQILEYKLRIF